jgi:hypothetical protein
MSFLLTLHSHNRWLFVLLAVVLIVKLTINLVKRNPWSGLDGILLRTYTALMSLQFLIGLILFYNLGSALNWDMKLLRLNLEHATTMIIALGLSHYTAKWKNSDSSTRSRNVLIVVSISLLLIILGVARLRGLQFWFA